VILFPGLSEEDRQTDRQTDRTDRQTETDRQTMLGKIARGGTDTDKIHTDGEATKERRP
jgi:hypothetical protein